MKKLLFAAALCLATHVANAAWHSVLQVSVGAAPSYTGPGDVVSSATAWWSCSRAYNAAQATALANACILRAATGTNAGNTKTITVLATGLFDVATANAWAGTDVSSISCSSATNTLTCTGASSTPSVGDTFTGSGATQPCFATAVGTFTGGAGTVTTGGAGCGTIASPVAMVAQGALYATEAYDQSGALACSSAACNATEAVTSEQPEWLPNCVNSQPCLFYNSANSSRLQSPSYTPSAATKTLSAVGSRITGTGLTYLGFIVASDYIGMPATANEWELLGGLGGDTLVTGVADGSFHSGNGVIDGTSSVFNVDGTEVTGTANGATAASAMYFGRTSGTATSYESELGLWNTVLFTQTQRTNMCANQATFYGTTIGTFC